MDETSRAQTTRATSYRWAVLVAFMAVNLTIQVLWLGLRPLVR